MPKKPIQWEVYRPIKGTPGAFIGIVEAPDEAIEEFGMINPEREPSLRATSASDDRLDC
jgi:hypothetical protein